jgi:alginate O-acetyltransferase complex protein AlgI
MLLMMGSTLVDYFVALRIDSAPTPAKRRAWLVFSVALNFSLLGVFKYFNFFIDSFVRAAGLFGFHDLPVGLLNIILPPGISFYTFQEVAYIVDVYHGRLKPSKNLIDYALFISLFPHLIAGPIQRPSHLLPQTQRPRVFNGDTFLGGCFLMISGLFRKVVIADNCALLANAAFDGKLGNGVIGHLIGVYAFAWQIYGDFSGYSDFARGSAQLLGFHFMVNFRQPYLATSLQDFWRRWHISLSTWLRDYLYIPLGGNRKGTLRTYGNLMTTMLLGGLWHGANWTFVVWGGIHGTGLSVERLILGKRLEEEGPFLIKWIRRIIIFHVVCLSWIFFRAKSIGDAFAYIRGFANFGWSPEYASALMFLAILIFGIALIDQRLELTGEEYVFQQRPEFQRVGLAFAMLVLALLFSATESNQFIYFQF